MIARRLLASVLAVLLCAPAFAQVTEVVPTSRQTPQTWRYTFDKPSNDKPSNGWTSPAFDDSSWPSARGGFGSAGTPGITPRTTWSTSDIWLRRSVTLPNDVDPAELALLVFHDE